jgi:hypothetical protein
VRTSRILAAALLGVAILTGCDGGYGPDGLKVVKQGRKPRQALRFQVEQGAQQRLSMNMALKLGMSVNGTTMPAQSAPLQSLDLECTVMNVAPNGDISYEMRLDGSGDLAGVSGSAIVTDRGVTKHVSLDLPPSVDPAMRQVMDTMKRSIEQFSSPFPEEEVGLGAKWKHKAMIDVMGMKVEQVTTFTLVALRGPRGRLKVEIEQEIDSDDLDVPGLPAGASVELEEFTSKGSGYIVFDLRQVVPPKAELDLAIELEMRAKFKGQTQNAKMQLSANVEMVGNDLLLAASD